MIPRLLLSLERLARVKGFPLVGQLVFRRFGLKIAAGRIAALREVEDMEKLVQDS